MTDQLLGEMSYRQRIVAWAEVVEPAVTTAPSLDFGAYAFDLSEAQSSSSLPDQAFGERRAETVEAAGS